MKRLLIVFFLFAMSFYINQPLAAPIGPGGIYGPTGGAGVTDHGALDGLSDDDHSAYVKSGDSTTLSTATIGNLNLTSVCSTDDYFLRWNTGNAVDCVAIAGGGDMLKSTYDVDEDGDIDQAAGGTELDTSGVTDGQLIIGTTSGNVWALGTLTAVANETDVRWIRRVYR
jgi:hypothetical protein